MAATAAIGSASPATAADLVATETTYTSTADFDMGTELNLISTGDELKLDETTTPFGFIWVAVSTKDRIVKINTDTGQIVGEYRTAPQSSSHGDPSRTTVDKNGSVWLSNRRGGTIIHIGLQENGRCVDRNMNGVIDTSTGLDDVRDWPGTVATDALDECILHFVQTANTDARHISVTEDNDIWVSGINGRVFQLVDGETGNILRTEGPVGYGGYGGLIDPNGVIWSANPLLRWDTANPLSGPMGENWTGYGHDSYGLCIDSQGNVWNTSLYNNQLRKFAPDGTLLGTFAHGSYYAQGCVVDGNDDVWVAGSLYDSVVGHVLNDGTLVGTVTVGSGPTGVAVDNHGKIWATNYGSGTVSRIDPALGPEGIPGHTVGAVDFTTVGLGGNPYNYSDMTGSTLIGAPDNGVWTLIHDAGTDGEFSLLFGPISWDADVPGDGALTVTAATSLNGVDFSTPQDVTSGEPLSVPPGRYIRVTVSFARSTEGDSPVLYDMTITTLECTQDEHCDDGIDCTIDTCNTGTNLCEFDYSECVCPNECGDPTRPGTITAIDAQTILHASVQLVECPLCVCDVDASEDILSNDALRDLQYAVHLDVELACYPDFPDPREPK